MDLLEKLERKDAMRAEYQRRQDIIQRYQLIFKECLLTTTFGVPCGMLPAVKDDDGDVVYYHGGCCSEAHHKMYNDYVSDSGKLRKKTVATEVEKAIKGFSTKITKLVEQYGKEEVNAILNSIS